MRQDGALAPRQEIFVTLTRLLEWQWQGYPRYHGSRTNLLIHIVAVPLFLACNVALIAALLQGLLALALVALAGMVLSLALQGRGHRLEDVPPEPFTGPGQAVARLFFEQWLTFPRFVLSGGWWRALAGSR
jgi:hypothetical protein